MNNQNQKTCIGIRVPKKLKDEISTAVKNGIFLNEADFVRSAIRDKLVRLKESR